ncbi:MAG: hypothetical protein FJZ01_20245 [Candidatus Sericytochromatia bacterium]|nr:hypothetical protein [Candidatus Tanganyikabacteria bacterium]
MEDSERPAGEAGEPQHPEPQKVKAARPGRAQKESVPPEPGVMYPIVGVGASAGGIEAMRGLIGGLGAKPGLAVIYVQHLDPSYESAVASIFGQITPMPVLRAEGRPGDQA